MARLLMALLVLDMARNLDMAHQLQVMEHSPTVLQRLASEASPMALHLLDSEANPMVLQVTALQATLATVPHLHTNQV